jgi:hypothetical protein
MVYAMERLDRPRSQVHTAVDPATVAEAELARATSTTRLAWTVHDQWPWGGL